MLEPEEIYCYWCMKTFYLNGFRMQEAKSVSCMFCGRRIYKEKQKEDICECGHEKNVHYKIRGCAEFINPYNCKCKKFKAK